MRNSTERNTKTKKNTHTHTQRKAAIKNIRKEMERKKWR